MTSSPLAGTLVVDLSRHLPGPLAAHLLADLGARVVKVEEPRVGDPVRLAPPLAGGRSQHGAQPEAGDGAQTKVKGRSTLAALLLSGAESVALDLKRPAGREVLEGLLERADVLLETFRPGTLARLGLEPEELRRRFPRLVVCSLSGWGQDGPYAPRAGHDLTYQALAGTLAATAAMPAYPAADVTGAWSAVSSVLAALLARERTGDGTRIDASLFDAAVHLNLVGWAEEGAAGPGESSAVGEPHGLSGALPCYRLYRTADGGWLAVAPLEEHFWQRFCEAAGRSDLRKLQYREDGTTHRKVARMVARRTLAEWRELLAGVDLPVEAVLPADEAARHPQTVARGVLKRGADGLFRLGFPARIGGERPRGGEAYPELGEHTDRIVEEVGGRVAELSPVRRRREGVGRRFSLRRALTRWALSRR